MHHAKSQLTKKILIAMLAGILIGVIVNKLPKAPWLTTYFTEGLFDIGGKIFISLLEMLVVPIVFVSLVCGTFNLDSSMRFGKIAAKTIFLYALTTAIAISLALVCAHLSGIGIGNNFVAKGSVNTHAIPSFKQTLLNIFPSNPVDAMAKGNMLQIILFSILLGLAITFAKEKGQRVRHIFNDFNEIVMILMSMVLKITPIGVFCLVASMFAQIGFSLIVKLASYFAIVLVALALQLLISYSSLIKVLTGLSPIQFIRNMMPAMLFAFSTSSSSASIPVVLNTVEKKCGVDNSIASFVIPLGATINMDGTAIMQGVATVFIANSYNINLGLTGFLKVILTATLASIGTAGIPSVGLITLTMVLMQVGLPIEGIALIIGVDRLLDMSRTAINITGDAMIACIVAAGEKAIDLTTFNGRDYE